jgi:hypothetical protein
MRQTDSASIRISCGRYVMPVAERLPYILRHARKPELDALPSSPNNLHSQITRGIRALRDDRTSHWKDSPMDLSGVRELRSQIPRAEDGTVLEALETAIDEFRPTVIRRVESPGVSIPMEDAEIEAKFRRRIRPIGPLLEFDVERHMTMAGPVTAKDILTNPERKGQSRLRQEVLVTVHSIEAHLVAVGALRARGYEAYFAEAETYPSRDVRPVAEPLIAIITMHADMALTTAALKREHPNMEGVVIRSDTEVVGATYAALAENMAKALVIEMIQRHAKKNDLNRTEMMTRLGDIAEALYQAHDRWPFSHYTSSALMTIEYELSQAMLAIKDEYNLLIQKGMQIQQGTYQPQGLGKLFFNPHTELQKIGRRMQEIEQQAVVEVRAMTKTVQDLLNAKVEKTS